MNIKGFRVEIQTPNTMKPHWPQHDSPAAFVIVQQCSSATFFSLRYHSRKEKLGALFKNHIFKFFFTF